MGGNLFTLPSVYRITTKVKQKSPLLTAQFSLLTKLICICMFLVFSLMVHIYEEIDVDWQYTTSECRALSFSCVSYALDVSRDPCVSYALDEMLNSVEGASPSPASGAPPCWCWSKFVPAASHVLMSHTETFYYTDKTYIWIWRIKIDWYFF